MRQVHSLLWIGNALDLREPKGLFDRDIRAIVDVAMEEPPAQLPRTLIYCRFPLVDGAGNATEVLIQSVVTLADLLSRNVKSVVGCSAGMSRSPTVAAFALAKLMQKDPMAVVEEIGRSKSLELNPALWNDMSTACAGLLEG